MSPEIEVRDAGVEDVEAVVDVAEAAWYAAYGGFLDPATVRRGLGENYDPELVEAAVEHENVAFFVAEADGEVVGFASAEQTWADEVELHTIYVHPDRWGEGAGSALLERVEAWAHERGVDRIACAAFAENSIGTDFFEAAGFRRGTEAEAEIAGEFHPEIEFELPL
jgi:N-acetylglutamate synthase-like GNAT family acetyltransferase